MPTKTRNMNSKSSQISYAIALLAVLGTSLTLPKTEAHDDPSVYLHFHNEARDEIGLEHLTWDQNLACYAQNYTQHLIGDCDLVHSDGPYGENLAASSGEMHAGEAVQLWVDEKQWYHYETNCCVPGQQCGHYTQIVWRDTARVGCFKAICNNGGTVISCNYDPPGNYVGERPY